LIAAFSLSKLDRAFVRDFPNHSEFRGV